MILPLGYMIRNEKKTVFSELAFAFYINYVVFFL